ncbi:hypothetical protein BGZ89_007246, partial [Linnemannia elongata]
VRVINAVNHNPANVYKVFITQLDEENLPLYRNIVSFYNKDGRAFNTAAQYDARPPALAVNDAG